MITPGLAAGGADGAGAGAETAGGVVTGAGTAGVGAVVLAGALDSVVVDCGAGAATGTAFVSGVVGVAADWVAGGGGGGAFSAGGGVAGAGVGSGAADGAGVGASTWNPTALDV